MQIANAGTGKAGMTLPEKILYIADYIEPGRDRALDLPEVRSLAFRDLELTMYKILSDTIDYLKRSGRAIDPVTEEAYRKFRRRIQERR